MTVSKAVSDLRRAHADGAEYTVTAWKHDEADGDIRHVVVAERTVTAHVVRQAINEVCRTDKRFRPNRGRNRLIAVTAHMRGNPGAWAVASPGKLYRVLLVDAKDAATAIDATHPFRP